MPKHFAPWPYNTMQYNFTIVFAFFGEGDFIINNNNNNNDDNQINYLYFNKTLSSWNLHMEAPMTNQSVAFHCSRDINHINSSNGHS